MQSTTTPTPTLEELAARLDRLERALQTPTRPGLIEATELRLIDSTGKAKAVLSVDDSGPFLTFADHNKEIQTEILPLVVWEPATHGPIDRARASLWSPK